MNIDRMWDMTILLETDVFGLNKWYFKQWIFVLCSLL